MKSKLFLTSLFAIAIVLTSCEGKEGPQGPAGSKGETGGKGDTGSKGDPGATGTANVIYSDWLPVPAKAVASSPSRKNFSFQAPKITQEIFDSGLIYGYLKYNINSSSGLTPLPYANKYLLASGEVAGSFLSTILVGVGSISLNQDWLTPGTIPSDFASSTSVIGGYTHLRYIIIPGGQKARVKGLDYTNYEAVKAYYGLED